MDALFFLKHSKHGDLEMRYALRGIERHAPWIRRVIIFGDRPSFLAGPESGVLHIPHDRIAWIGPYKTPVINFFRLSFLTALLPELDEEYLFFSDDFVLLQDLSPEQARVARYLQDLGKVQNRGKGLWKESLWRTYDLLKRLGYSGWNFETHVPTYFKKQWVLDAFRDLGDYSTADRFYGLLGPTTILNHAWKADPRPLVLLSEEGSRAGYYGKLSNTAEIEDAVAGKTFLNFDDDAFGPDLQRFLIERFPTPSRFEQ